MAYSGELKPLEPNSNRPLPIRPPPERWENVQTTEAKQNKRTKLNAPSIPEASFVIPPVPENNKTIADFQLTAYENLPPIINPTSPFINSYSIHNTVLLLTPLSSINQPCVNLPHVIYSNSINYSYSYCDSFLHSPVHFVFPSSDQIASDIIHFLVEASPHTSPNNLQLVVFENMLNKNFKLTLISYINSLLVAFSNRDYTTFQSVIRSCIARFGLR